jgi:hypothetical protein
MEKYCTADDVAKEHIQLLVKFTQQHFASTFDRLNALLKECKIEYDLLWALFKPNAEVFMVCDWTEQPMCVKYRCGEERERDGANYWRLECQYIEYDGKSLGYSTLYRRINQFHGAKPITQLAAYPLELHPRRDDVRAQFIEMGEKFVDHIGIQHVQYNGLAIHLDHNEKLETVHIKSRVIVDSVSFRENNPKFPSRKRDEPLTNLDIFTISEASVGIKHVDLDSMDMTEDDLVICSHLIYGFVLNEKQWSK